VWHIVIWLPKALLFDSRVPVSRTLLQSAITDAVKKADPSCEDFVGVIVKRETPKSRFDANWAIRGIKFGRADRDKSSKAVAIVVRHMQQDFQLSEDGDA
jgi:hypothetical protein